MDSKFKEKSHLIDKENLFQIDNLLNYACNNNFYIFNFLYKKIKFITKEETIKFLHNKLSKDLLQLDDKT